MRRETDSPAPDTPVPSLPEAPCFASVGSISVALSYCWQEQGTINGERPVCRLVYYRIRKSEQCFDCRATLWTVVAWKCILCFCAAYWS